MLILLKTQTSEYNSVKNRKDLDRLLLEIAAGNQDALAMLYNQTRTAVYGLALSYLKNAHDAQDVTQDTFIRVWDCANQYQSHGSPMGWLMTVARNLALTKLRQGGRQMDLEDGEWDAIPAGNSHVSPEDRHVLQTALSTLGDEERQVVLLHAVTGLKHREIAVLLELPLATVLSKYYRALKKLRIQLEGDNTP